MNTRNEGSNDRPRRRPTFRLVEVTHVEQLSPRMVRVTLHGDTLAGFAWNGPAAHIKIIFPAPGEDTPIMPEDDGPQPIMRTYTPRRFDAATHKLDVEFVLHGDGPASTWAAHARPGQRLVIAGPGLSYEIDPDVDWYMLVGDEAALPAISTILEHLPAKKTALVFLEVVDAQEERMVHSVANVSYTWLHRGNDLQRAGTRLEEALRTVTFPVGDGAIYVGCEATTMRRIWTYLVRERNIPYDRLVTRGYWKLNVPNHPDHDYGNDT